ncbi:hypothetical protein HNR46_002653 [Haloferula luteola]|uniref:Secreted protein n=1 Tax=Haloferula luteola TaxID=595692 RepID=A0A840VCN6_9BACT|nr:hypothetical protein [Haloferula luteola]MBB5352408.1 hypothetical protein [Haloferula luteola]
MRCIYWILALTTTWAFAEPVPSPSHEDATLRHQESSQRLSDQQDELAADVQQLTIEQTAEEVILLFREVEDAMDEASERLWEHETGGETLAAQTDVIEKIYQAAKKRQQQSGEGSPESGAMMKMLERMLGIDGETGKPQQGKQPSQQGDGEGMTGDSDLANQNVQGTASGASETRRVPKGAGVAGKSLPDEFSEALKAYNRGLRRLEP